MSTDQPVTDDTPTEDTPTPEEHPTPEPIVALVAAPPQPVGALAVRPGQRAWTIEQKAALHQIGVEEASEGDLMVFLNYAQRTGLDPFARQIYMVGRWDNRSGRTKWAIQAGIDGLRIVANRSQAYRGQTSTEWCGPDGLWRNVWLESTPPAASRIGVHRAGFVEPLYAVARWDSYCPTTRDGKPMGLWSKMPDVMLAKVAEALALRKAFPMDLAGIYTSDEMEQAGPAEVTPAPPVAPPEPTDEERVAAQDYADAACYQLGNRAALTDLWKDAGEALRLLPVTAPDGYPGPPPADGQVLTLGELIVACGKASPRDVEAPAPAPEEPAAPAAPAERPRCQEPKKGDPAGACDLLPGHAGNHRYART